MEVIVTWNIYSSGKKYSDVSHINETSPQAPFLHFPITQQRGNLALDFLYSGIIFSSLRSRGLLAIPCTWTHWLSSTVLQGAVTYCYLCPEDSSHSRAVPCTQAAREAHLGNWGFATGKVNTPANESAPYSFVNRDCSLLLTKLCFFLYRTVWLSI